MIQAPTIRILPEETANRIAAGEVVERPASVLKELMENSLDAGATRIQVEIQKGGRGLLKVLDNGWGMTPDDLLLSLERHATSKLRQADDLETVATLGFRGEALPSIAAVSRLSLRSRPADREAGHELLAEGGVIKHSRDVGCPTGTLITMRDLFFNTPARQKFLKSQSTEAHHISQAFIRLALSRPDVGLSLSSGGQTLYDLPPHNSLEERAALTLGRALAGQMTALEQQAGPLEVRGLISLPNLSRHNLEQAYFFINGRHVRDRTLLHALAQAYKGLMPPDRKPVVVLHITMDPALVDVNVHPAKTEVRFSDTGLIHQSLLQALTRGLHKGPEPKPVWGAEPEPDLPPSCPQPDAALGLRPAGPDLRPPLGQAELAGPVPALWAAAPSSGAGFAPGGSQARSGPEPGLWGPPPRPEQDAPSARDLARALPGLSPQALFSAAAELQVLGQLHGLYILCSAPQGLVIIDQHAAHERLAYEELRRAFQASAVPAQPLLQPVVLELTPLEAAQAEIQAPHWARLGLELTPFGPHSWAVSTLPVWLAGQDPEPLVRAVLAEVSAAALPVDTPEYMEVAMRSLACRASILKGRHLSPDLMADLVSRLAALPPPLTCPHGRPVMLLISRRDLARGFKRSAEAGLPG